MDSGTKINLFGNPSMTTNIQNADTPMSFMTNIGSKIGYEVG